MSIPVLIGEKDGISLSTNQIRCFIIFSLLQKTYIFCKINADWKESTFSLKHKDTQFSCELVKSLDSSYRSQLDQLISKIDISESFSLLDHSMALFKITDYEIGPCKSYMISDPTYGEEVFLKEGGKKATRVFSNCFKHNTKYFYFLNNQDQLEDESISEIIDRTQSTIFGFNLKIGKLNLCVPLKQLLFDTSTPFSVKMDIQQNLKKVVYLNHDGSHCTGTLISSTLILTVRHFFSISQPKIGTVVKVRLYPFNQVKMAKLVYLSSKFIDLILLSLIQEKQQPHNSQQFASLFNHLPTVSKIRIGTKVYAIGFGKYPYFNFHFETTEMLLPTITYGIVSKVTSHNSQQIYFKTDCILYNGYSGGAIWSQDGWIGNTIFIVKNKVNLSKHPRHNFNYTRNFIQLYLQEREKIEKSKSFQDFFTQFQGIHTRKELKIKAKL